MVKPLSYDSHPEHTIFSAARYVYWASDRPLHSDEATQIILEWGNCKLKSRGGTTPERSVNAAISQAGLTFKKVRSSVYCFIVDRGEEIIVNRGEEIAKEERKKIEEELFILSNINLRISPDRIQQLIETCSKLAKVIRPRVLSHPEIYEELYFEYYKLKAAAELALERLGDGDGQ